MKNKLRTNCKVIFFLTIFINMLLSHLLINTSFAKDIILNYLIFPAPPYIIDNSQNEQENKGLLEKKIGIEDSKNDNDINDKTITGVDVEIIKIIAQRMNMRLKIQRCPWKRCLVLMESGEADILSSVFKKPEREIYLNYFETPYLNHLPIAFYTLRDKNYHIEKYEGIYDLNTVVGVLRGASYFDRFDKDKKVKKYEVNSQEQLIPMLIEERFNAFAGYVDTVNYILVTEGFNHKIQKSIYEHNDISNVYMAISKRSPLASLMVKFNAVNNDLIKDGTIDRIIKEFYDKYRVE
ncbi:MAG: transporter substrate-binding domain-containing protein [Desulfamplus sp.]|nr:transporter substrate-binding domain-containing protein [Desulfamplus sp.]